MAAAGRKVSETEKRLLWELVGQDARRLRAFGFHVPEPRRFAEWVQEVTVAGLGRGPKSALCKVAGEVFAAIKRRVAWWLAPRTSKGQCKRSPVEQRAFAAVNVATTLLQTFEG